MHWTFEQHLAHMRSEGITFLPREGDGIRTPWRVHVGDLERDKTREHRVLNDYCARHMPNYFSLISSMAEDLPGMDQACRLSVLLPCRNEAQHIEAMLSLLTEQFSLDGQLLPREAYEVIVLVNNTHGELPDETATLARRWYHPAGLIVHVIEYVHDVGERAPLTMARKILADLAVWRASQRVTSSGALYLACEDADVIWVDPFQLATMINVLDANPGLDCIRGQQDRCPWEMIQHPLLLLMRRSWNFCEAHAARRSLRPENNPRYNFNWNRVVSSGWNTAFSAEVYAQIGGYTRQRLFEEDMDIGEKISCLRAYPTSQGLLPQVNTTTSISTRSEGSPRRWFYRIAKGIEPYDDTNDYENFLAHRHELVIKSTPLTDLGRSIAPYTQLTAANIPLLREILQRDLNFMKTNRGCSKQGTLDYQWVLRKIGFQEGEVAISEGQLEILDLKSVKGRVEHLASRLPARPVSPWLQLSSAYRRSWHGVWGKQEPQHQDLGSSCYRVALVGCGRIVEEGHAPAYRAITTGERSFNVFAIVDPSPERRTLIGKQLKIPPSRRFSSLSQMFLASQVDGVVIATPSDLHYDAAYAAIEEGLDVICEKPLAVTTDQVRILLDLARQKDVKIGCLHNYLTCDLWSQAMALIHKEKLGPPRRLSISVSAPEPLPGFSPSDPYWRLSLAKGGRGCLLDQGYHFFYLAEALFGPDILSLDAEITCSGLPGREVDDFAVAKLHHGNGGETLIAIDWNHPTLVPPAYVIDCERGSLVLNEDAQSIEIQTLSGTRKIDASGGDPYGYHGSLVSSLTALALGQPPITTGDAALRTLSWVERAYRAAGFIDRVTLQPVCDGTS